tara:strand:- start:179 stop:874 length:696 start_codon:yes stop_codon:yes gene_type:complete
MKITRNQLRQIIKEELFTEEDEAQGGESDKEFARQMAIIIALEMIEGTRGPLGRKARRAAEKADVSRMADLHYGAKLLRIDRSRGQFGTEFVYTVDLGDQDLKAALLDIITKGDTKYLNDTMKRHDTTGRHSLGRVGNSTNPTAITIGIIDSQAEAGALNEQEAGTAMDTLRNLLGSMGDLVDQLANTPETSEVIDKLTPDAAQKLAVLAFQAAQSAIESELENYARSSDT